MVIKIPRLLTKIMGSASFAKKRITTLNPEKFSQR